MELLDWLSFMYHAAGAQPIEPAQYGPDSRRYAEAKAEWDAWHSYVAAIVRLARDPRTEALILYRNVQVDSSQFGRQTVMAVGGERTYKTIDECEGGYLYALPSERQYAQCATDCRDKEALCDVIEALSRAD